jgi:NAD-dependent SIR2 family protein deacetylase
MSVTDKVVYLLGAGFSAPLGLPVMSNFRMKSEEMFASDPKAYPHFENVFKTIKELSL